MKFNIAKREGKFTHGNFRNEKKGRNEVTPATDLSVTFSGTKRDIDMLLPHPDKGIKMSDVLYDAAGNIMLPFMSPFKLARRPEGVLFTVWDQATNTRKPMVFEGCKVKDINFITKEKRNLIIALKIQLHDNPEADTARLRRLVDTERQFSLVAQQEEIFDEDPEDDENDGQDELDVDEEQDDEPEDEEPDEDEDD